MESLSIPWLFLYFAVFWRCVFTFPPQAVLNEPESMSHSYITLVALHRTAAEFLIRYQFVNNTDLSTTETVKSFFGTDSNSYLEFFRTIRQIVAFQNEIQENFKDTAFYHVHGEQIKHAHTYIRSLKRSVQEYVMTANPDIGLIREKIGYALYTLQEFYSNTNWVELNGDTVYEDFGQDNVSLVDIARGDEDTCNDCIVGTNGEYICINNIFTTALTSGYKSDEDIAKPVGKGLNTGKCSIGTFDDQSKDRCAIGGIYKGRRTKEEAPHYYLHDHAVNAAIKATQYFLLDEGNGIINLLGQRLFMDVFHLQSKESVVDTSLTFVVDVTGSMGSDIDAVIASLTTIVTESRSLEFIPSKYALVTFSDPENLTTGRETRDWAEMIGWMKNITVSGGDDCPEYAMSGLLKGIEMSNTNSRIYLCTDASAKDSTKVSDLIHGLTVKSLKPVFLLTGSCDGIGWETLKTLALVERQNISVFEKIAQKTGGSTHYTNIAGLEKIIVEDIKNTFPSSIVLVQCLELDPLKFNTVTNIPVDNTIKVLHIEIFGASSTAGLYLLDPHGRGYSNAFIKDNIITMSITNPSTGLWLLSKLEKRKWIVNITAQSRLDFDVALLHTSGNGHSHHISGNPILGHNYTIAVDVQNLRNTSTCHSIVLLDRRGREVYVFNVKGFKAEGIWRFYANFKYPIMPVPQQKIHAVMIKGTDSQGNKYLRTRRYVMQSVPVKLVIIPLIRDLSLNVNETILFDILNCGDIRGRFIVSASDDQGFVLDPLLSTFQLESGEKDTGIINIRATFPSIVNLNITVTSGNSNEPLQTYIKTYSISHIHRPVCSNMNSNFSACPPKEVTSNNCSNYFWTTRSLVISSDVKVSTIEALNRDVKLSYDNVIGVTNAIRVQLSGHCCYDNVVLNVIDKEGFSTRCVQKIQYNVTENVTTTIPKESSSDSKFERPTCSIWNINSSTCPHGIDGIYAGNCLLFTWNITALVNFSGGKLSSIDMENNDVEVIHENFTGILEGPVQVYLSGVCCTVRVAMNIIDGDGNSTRCIFDLLEEQHKKNATEGTTLLNTSTKHLLEEQYKESTTEGTILLNTSAKHTESSSKDDSKLWIAVIASSSTGFVVLLIVFAVLLHRCAQKRSNTNNI